MTVSGLEPSIRIARATSAPPTRGFLVSLFVFYFYLFIFVCMNVCTDFCTDAARPGFNFEPPPPPD